MSASRAGARIADEVGGWPEVTSGPHRFGGVEFKLGRRQLGHLHGDSAADLPFPVGVRDELIASGRAREHRWTKPGSGWVTVPIGGPGDVEAVIELFRQNYERAIAAATKQRGR
jgi:Luciferase